MTDIAQISLIIAIAVVLLGGITLFILKDKLRASKFETTKRGIKASIETQGPSRISGTKIKGNQNKLTAKDGGKIEKSEIEGDKNQLDSGGL